MKKKTTLLKSLLIAAGLLFWGANCAWAGDKTVVKYSFDDATSPSLTAPSKVSYDYSATSVATSTKFLNIWSSENNRTGNTSINLSPNSEDISTQTWTLTYYWAGLVGGNGKDGNIYLKAGSTNLFRIQDAATYGGKMTLTYGETGTADITCPNVTKAVRFSANTKNLYNTESGWYLFTVTGDPTNGVKLTIAPAAGGDDVVSNVVLSETNVTPTELTLALGSIASYGMDELSLTYYVEGEVIQNPVPNYTAVSGASRTITATCETDGVTIQHSADGVNFEDGASITVSESGNVYFKAVKGGSESDIIPFAVVAGEITLNAPTIVRSDNTTVTITADQTDKLLSPTATIYYEYGAEIGSFTGTKVLTVAADATITAYAEATGYTTSSTAERAVALFPANNAVETIENTPTKTNGTTKFALGTDVTTVSERDYVALLLDDVQWGTNVYLQNLTLSDPIVWGIRNGNWYVNTLENQWVLIRNMKAGDIIVANVNFAAAETVNATYSEKLTYATRHAYIVDADGDVELAFKKPNAKEMDYIYGFYAYRPITSVSATITSECGLATFCSDKALDFSAVEGLTAYIVTSTEGIAQLAKVTKVPAGTGVILEGEPKTYEVPVIATADAIEGNLLKAAITETTAVKGDYVLAYKSEVRGFFPAEEDLEIRAGKAYLHIDSGNAPAFLPFAGETTGISTIAAAEKAQDGIFNMAGQRVAQPTKGLYIVNGKKVVLK